MSESLLEALRRQIREAEERLKRSNTAEPKTKVTLPAHEVAKKAAELPARPASEIGKSEENLAKATEQIHNLEKQIASSDGLSEWVAYGQMTPAILKELSQFIDSTIRDASIRFRDTENRSAARPGLIRLAQGMDRVRATLDAWAESADFLGTTRRNLRLEELLREALSSRRAELERWSIQTALQLPDVKAQDYLCPPQLFPIILHILQSCIEEVRESGTKARLTIRTQILGDRLETNFIYELSRGPGEATTPKGEIVPAEHLRLKNVEILAARRLLDSIGGTLVLENVTETQHAIRMNLSLATLRGEALNLPLQQQGGH